MYLFYEKVGKCSHAVHHVIDKLGSYPAWRKQKQRKKLQIKKELPEPEVFKLNNFIKSVDF